MLSVDDVCGRWAGHCRWFTDFVAAHSDVLAAFGIGFGIVSFMLLLSWISDRITGR